VSEPERAIPTADRVSRRRFMVGLTAAAALAAPAAREGWAAETQDGATRDEFGGVRATGASRGVAFRVQKLGDRWTWLTPEGNPFWLRGVYNVNVSTSKTDRSLTYREQVIAKYGDADLRWAPAQNRRLRQWGFNAIGEYASSYTLPWATINDPRWAGGKQPVRMPAVPFPLQAASYAQRNLFNFAKGPVKEIYWALDAHFKGYRGQFPDIFDPNFDQWVTGRVAATEYAQAAASPWLLGFSSDDTDYLTGFGPGPDFDTGGHTHPHLGYVALLTPPTQAENSRIGVTYTDAKVYIKHALRDFVRARYNTVAALNTAWGSNYTTFDSDGGWPNGRGLLDENGKGRWVGTDPSALRDARGRVGTDLDDFLYEIAERYFSIYRTRIKQRYPHVLYLGSSTIGGWGAPPRRQILRAAGQLVDVIRTTYNGEQRRLDFMTEHAGDKPLMTWLGAVANPDSALFRYPNGGQSNMFNSQTERGAYYQSALGALLNATAGTSGTKPFIGMQWWEYLDNWGEKANWGLVTLSDNAYDGREAVVARGVDSTGLTVGGEDRDFGDFLSVVRRMNLDIDLQLRLKLQNAKPR
jgi:hypothetical protein